MCYINVWRTASLFTWATIKSPSDESVWRQKNLIWPKNLWVSHGALRLWLFHMIKPHINLGKCKKLRLKLVFNHSAALIKFTWTVFNEPVWLDGIINTHVHDNWRLTSNRESSHSDKHFHYNSFDHGDLKGHRSVVDFSYSSSASRERQRHEIPALI